MSPAVVVKVNFNIKIAPTALVNTAAKYQQLQSRITSPDSKLALPLMM